MKFDGVFVRFILVGILNAVFGYGVFTLFLFLGLHYSIAAALGTILGVFFNFKTTGVLVFKNNDNRMIFRFIGVYALIYLISVLFLRIAEFYGISLYLMGFLLIGLSAILSYILNKKFVFGVNYEKN